MNGVFQHSPLTASKLLKGIVEDISKKDMSAIVPLPPQTKQEASKYLTDAKEYIGPDMFKTYQFFEDDYDFNMNTVTIDFTDIATSPSFASNKIYVNGREFEVPVEVPYNYASDGTLSSKLNESKQKKKRNYRKEYDNYQGTPEQRANRSKRVLARRLMMKLGRVHKGDGVDVDHKDGNPQHNSLSNLRARSKSANRADHKDG